MEKQSASPHASTAYPYVLHEDAKQPIINGNLPASQIIENENPYGDGSQAQKAAWISWREVRAQMSLAGPLILGSILYFLLQLVSTTFVGHTGSLELSGAALANSFAVVTGYSVLMGMSGALETLCGQSFGAGDYKMLGVYMQRLMIVLNVTAVPLAVLWIFIEQIFGTLGQDAELASKAGTYGSLGYKACRAPFSSAALHDLNDLLQLAIPSALMTCLEWWSYEILVIISGFLPNPQLQTGIIAICVNSETLLYMIPNGLGSAVSTRVSNELGAGNPQGARQAANVARVLSSLEALIVIVVLLLVRNVWGLIYSSDKEMVATIAAFIPFFATSSAFDALQAVLSGVIRGAGWQKAGAYMNLASFYIAGLPTGCLLAFVAHLEGKGLWMGLIVGTIVQFATYIGLIYFMDWELEAKSAAARMGVSSSASQPLLSSA